MDSSTGFVSSLLSDKESKNREEANAAIFTSRYEAQVTFKQKTATLAGSRFIWVEKSDYLITIR